MPDSGGEDEESHGDFKGRRCGETYVDNEIAVENLTKMAKQTDVSDKPEAGRRKIQRTDYSVRSSKRSRKYAGSELWPNTGIQQSRGHPQLGYG